MREKASLPSAWHGSPLLHAALLEAVEATVEGSLVLTSALVRKKALVPGAQTAGSWGWTYEGEDGPHATIRYEADLRDTDNAWLRLHYRANGEAVDYKVQLVTTKPGTLHENEHHLEMCAAPDGSGRLDGASVRSQLPKLHNKKSRDRRRAKWKYTDIIPQSVAQRAATTNKSPASERG